MSQAASIGPARTGRAYSRAVRVHGHQSKESVAGSCQVDAEAGFGQKWSPPTPTPLGSTQPPSDGDAYGQRSRIKHGFTVDSLTSPVPDSLGARLPTGRSPDRRSPTALHSATAIACCRVVFSPLKVSIGEHQMSRRIPFPLRRPPPIPHASKGARCHSCFGSSTADGPKTQSSPLVRTDSPAAQFRPVGFKSCQVDSRPSSSSRLPVMHDSHQAKGRGIPQKGSVAHVEVFRMAGMGTPLLGGLGAHLSTGAPACAARSTAKRHICYRRVRLRPRLGCSLVLRRRAA